MRKSTTEIWRGQGYELESPPRRTLQQEAQGPMRLTWGTNGLQWTEPGSTLLHDTAYGDSESLTITNRRLRSTLAQEIGNVNDLPPPMPNSPSSAMLATPPANRTGGSLCRTYAFAEGLGGRPLSESPPPPASSSVMRTASNRREHRQAPYLLQHVTPSSRIRSTQQLQRRGRNSLDAEGIDKEECNKHEGAH